MARTDDELLGDIRRHLGDHMGGYTDTWRKAIALSRASVAHALEAAKYKRDCDHPGGYMRTCFLNACQKAGIDVPPEIFGRKTREATRP